MSNPMNDGDSGYDDVFGQSLTEFDVWVDSPEASGRKLPLDREGRGEEQESAGIASRIENDVDNRDGETRQDDHRKHRRSNGSSSKRNGSSGKGRSSKDAKTS